MNPFHQIQVEDRGFAPNCIFDIGANVGQTVRLIRRVWPDVQVHAFEPVSTTFAKLQENTAGDPAVTCHRLAFGSRAGRASMMAHPLGVMNRFVGVQPPRGPVEEVEVVAGDEYCAAQGIPRIDVLKIDTEGHDLDVLAGFRNMLATHSIDYIEVECAIAPANSFHVPLSRLADFLSAFDYGLFALHPGARFNPTKRRQDRGIWYGNAVFVAERPIEAAAPPVAAA
jgi:FkbM family methyltransferase